MLAELELLSLSGSGLLEELRISTVFRFIGDLVNGCSESDESDRERALAFIRCTPIII